MTSTETSLSILFSRWSGEKVLDMVPLPGSGSYRRYYRIRGKKHTAIGAFHEDRKENSAFLSFTGHFFRSGLPVPEIFATDEGNSVYLLKDLGDITLFDLLDSSRREITGFPENALAMYRKAIGWLPRFQVAAGKGIDYSACYPRAAFDRQSMLWDLNYFKYYFLKLAKVPFDEQRLEDDFGRLSGFLEGAGSGHFMYRDFQSRNIMISGDETWFIDYQGGRKGPLQYDIASLLYDAKADIPVEIREELLSLYLEELNKQIRTDETVFRKYYHGFVLIRILQALGAYGFRGYYENKPHFLRSIPYAMRNLEYLMEKNRFPEGLTVLRSLLEKMVRDPSFREMRKPGGKLVLNVFSFSYRDPIPADETGNGGGFVFDCRALPNPGRHPEYQDLTGLDKPVIAFLKKEPEVDAFLVQVFSLVDGSIRNYLDRDFSNLMVTFGCTGGQHRSVYCAEELAKHIREKFSVHVNVRHTGLEK
jgi:aminoglycoside/choline kinase family phosphotransferase